MRCHVELGGQISRRNRVEKLCVRAREDRLSTYDLGRQMAVLFLLVTRDGDDLIMVRSTILQNVSRVSHGVVEARDQESRRMNCWLYFCTLFVRFSQRPRAPLEGDSRLSQHCVPSGGHQMGHAKKGHENNICSMQ